MPTVADDKHTHAKAMAENRPFALIEEMAFPAGYRLLVGTSQLYELELAIAESRVLSARGIISRGAYFASVKGDVTNHVKMCGVTPVQVDPASSARRKNFFAANIFKTGYATHGLFPYRGKFHPQMVKAIINIIGMKRGETLLDPMMGSGTACLEATLIGVDAVGIDASPFCVLMAEGKEQGACANAADVVALSRQAEQLFDDLDSGDPQTSLFASNGDARRVTRKRINPEIGKLVHLCYLDAMGYAARRLSKGRRDLFPVVLQRYVAAVRNFARIRDELGLQLGQGRYVQGDARNLRAAGLEDESIHGVLTSPPYSFAIDYLANDAAQLNYLGVNDAELRKSMIGLRGAALRQRVDFYLHDMQTVFAECARVLKPGRYAVFVVGTNSNQLKRALGDAADELRIDERFIDIASHYKLNLKRDIIHPIEGIHNTMRDEHILFFRKS